MNKRLFKEAIENAYLKLAAMDDAEFEALLAKNKDGEYARIVRETNSPGVGTSERIPYLESICFDTYIQISSQSFAYALDSTGSFIIHDASVLADGWLFNGIVTNANNWNIHDEDYSWAMAA
ncbi:MAG: hypothetical protein ACYC7J_16670 [Syntrophales bacterium]